jgi:hypothetical protein
VIDGNEKHTPYTDFWSIPRTSNAPASHLFEIQNTSHSKTLFTLLLLRLLRSNVHCHNTGKQTSGVIVTTKGLRENKRKGVVNISPKQHRQKRRRKKI